LGPCIDESSRGGSAGERPNRKWSAFGAGALPVDPDLKPQSSDEIVLGGEYALIKDGRLGVIYTKRWMNTAIEDMSRDEGRTFFIGNPGYGIASDFPEAKRNYDAMTLYFAKTFGDSWLAEASYTWSYLRGNLAGLYHPPSGQLSPNITPDFDYRSILPNIYGPLPGDRTHQIKLFAAKDWSPAPEHHVLTAVALRAHSGEPTSFLGDHYPTGQVFILERGSGERLPWVYGADLQVGYRYEIDKTKAVQVTIDVFNLLNFQAATARDETYTTPTTYLIPVTNRDLSTLKQTDGTPFDPAIGKNPNFGHPSQYQAPRQFRFGLRTTF
jgi:hypothetical protein